MKIVLIAPSGAVASALDQLDTVPDQDEIVVSARVSPDTYVPFIIVTPSLQALTARAETMLSGSVAGRNIQRLTPLDRGRRFAAATRHSKKMRDHVAAADMIVVLERDGLLAGWLAARKWAPKHARAVYGVAPAQAILAETHS